MNKILVFISLISWVILITGCEDKEQTTDKPNQENASEWTIFRGSPGLNGVSAGKIPDNPELLWNFKTEYEIKSSPVIADDKIFIGSNDGHVYALDLKSGKEIWKFDAGDDIEAAPLYYNQTIYIGSLNNEFYALDAGTGALKWKYKTDGEIYGSANIIESEESAQSLVLFGSYDNFLYCLNAETGEKKWSYETDNYINGTPALDDDWIIFGGCDRLCAHIKGK